MKVKVKNIWYDSENEALCVELSEQDKINIVHMHPDCTKYCVYNKADYTQEEIENWME